MDEFEVEMKKTFLEEAEQLLEQAEGAFISLDAGDTSKDLIDLIFRLAHNFKGSAKAVGFDALSKFAHKLEDVLTKIKNGDLKPTKNVCNVLFASLDILKAYVAGYKDSFDFATDTTAVEARLIDLKENGDTGTAAASASSATGASSSNSGPNQVEKVQENLSAVLDEMLGFTTKKEVISTPVLKAAMGTNGVDQPKTAIKANADDEVIRVATKKLDELLNLVGELVVNQSMVRDHRMKGTIASDEAIRILAYIEKTVTEIQDVSMGLRMLPVKPLFQKMKRTVRDVSQIQKKEIDLILEGEHVELDKTVLERITDPLTHLLRNAVDHGIEDPEERAASGKPMQAKVILSAVHREDRILITIKDDGRGLDREKLVNSAIKKGILDPGVQLTDEDAYRLIFKPGFSTKEVVTDISGRGVGMDVVAKSVEELKGAIEIKTKLGEGTSFIITLPLSLAIISGMVIKVDDKKYVIPVAQLVETIEYAKMKIDTSTGKGRMMSLRSEIIPVFSLGQILHGTAKSNEKTSGIITYCAGKKISFEIDEIVGLQQIVLKKLGHEMRQLPGIIAGAILSSGEPGLILNLQDLLGFPEGTGADGAKKGQHARAA